MKRKVIVLGAGLAGLSAADRLAVHDTDVTVIEKQNYVGGLASTFTQREGFRFDYGPHRFHTLNQQILDRVSGMMHDPLMELERLSRIRLLNRFFVYPLSLSDVAKQMPLNKTIMMILSYLNEKVRFPSRKNEDNFEEWVIHRFGRKLYDIYFGPYTEKLWGCKPAEMSSDWASQRITVVSLTRLFSETILPGKKNIRSLVSKFHYPSGGIGKIAEAFSRRIKDSSSRILKGTVPLHINRINDQYLVKTSSGELTADSIINTIPVSDYVSLLGDLLPERIHSLTSNLSFRSLVFVTLRISRRIPIKDHWIYFPEKPYGFNRVSIAENFDPNLPEDKTQITFEFGCQFNDSVWAASTELVRECAEKGAKLGLFKISEIEDSVVTRHEHAYPIYHKGYSLLVSEILNALDDLPGSVTCGRQGLFRYNNMDHSIEMGDSAAMEVLGKASVKEKFNWNDTTWADG